MEILLKGILLGLSIAAPVGPIGLLCIKRSLNNGFKSGLATGMGAASADAIYGTIAALGVTIIISLLNRFNLFITCAGALFLIYLGIKTFLSKPSEKVSEDKKGNLFSDYLTTLGLTLTNPVTIAMFIGVFTGLGVASNDMMSAFTLVLGVFLGSAIWWLFLSILVSLVRTKLNTNILTWVNRVSGLLIIALAVISLVNLLF